MSSSDSGAAPVPPAPPPPQIPTQPDFAVFVVESPRADDAYSHRSEMAALQLVGQLDEIPVYGRFALDREHFERALKEDVGKILTQHFSTKQGPLILFLHIGAHGDAEGFELSNHDSVTWVELRELLVPICRHLAGLLVLSMSSCEGFQAIRAALRLGTPEDTQYPFAALVGSTGAPTWSDTAIGYATLYHRLRQGATVADAVEAMRVASGHPHFGWATAEQIRTAFIQFVADRIRQTAQTAPPATE